MVGQAEHWHFGEAGFEMLESSVCVRGLVEVYIFFGQVEQGSGDMGVV